MRFFGKAYVACLLVFAGMLCGCNGQPPAPVNPETKTRPLTSGYPELVETGNGIPVLIDADTGCQYLQVTGRSLTPRMTNALGVYRQMGCKN